MQVMILAVLGLIIFVAGVAVATIHGTHLRGSGLGTVLIVIGVVLLLVSAVRYRSKPAK